MRSRYKFITKVWQSVRAGTAAALSLVAITTAQEVTAQQLLNKNDVNKLLQRASMATPSRDAIIAVVDRAGRILGVRIEEQIEISYAGRPSELVFAIDGAVAKARTAAFFSNGEAPLTSRTIRFISQSTITQREVECNPNDPNFGSTRRGPGFVAPIGLGGRFPPEVNNTPLVDLFAIEHQSRDSRIHPGADGMKGTGDDLLLTSRFDVNLAHVPAAAQEFMTSFPESYGLPSGRFMTAQSRGIGTLPGGIGLYKNKQLVGGIGVFFPGSNGYASNEQGFEHTSKRATKNLPTQTEAERINAPRVLEAEFIAFFASRGTTFGDPTIKLTSVDEFERPATIPNGEGFGGPIGRIDLVGITLEIYGPNPTRTNPVPGTERLMQIGRQLGGGSGVNSGANQLVNGSETVLDGKPVPEGWLVLPHTSPTDSTFSAAKVEQIIKQGIAEADITRAAIRLNPATGFRPGARTKMVLAVSDNNGEVLGLFRMPDATIFSIDVAVAKSRNTSYYASAFLQNPDKVDHNNDGNADVPLRTAFTNRTFRFLAGPNFPTAASTASGPPGDFSILSLPGINRANAENTIDGSPFSASFYASGAATVVAFDAFNPSRNFRDTRNLRRQNGIVFFPGSTPLYDIPAANRLIGGFGVSGDGVDQDDVVTVAGQNGFQAPTAIRADQFQVSGVRLPFQKFNRNPGG